MINSLRTSFLHRESNDLVRPLQGWTNSLRRCVLDALVEWLKEWGEESQAEDMRQILVSLPEEER
jgi:hypothetical protein